MLKDNLIKIGIIIVLFISCMPQKNESALISDTQMKQLIGVFIDDNERVNSTDHVIFIECDTISKEELFLLVASDTKRDLYFASEDDCKDIYFGSYKGFIVLVKDEKSITEKRKFRTKVPSNDYFASAETIPIMYDGAIWSITIKDNVIIPQFYTPSEEAIKRLELIWKDK